MPCHASPGTLYPVSTVYITTRAGFAPLFIDFWIYSSISFFYFPSDLGPVPDLYIDRSIGDIYYHAAYM